ncbi:MAG: methyltransferase family protein [Thermoanaerobaculia bacterium]
MYIGGTAVMLGAGLALSSPSIVLLALAFLLIMHLFVVLHEEPALADKFGASYEQYRSSVHRWLMRKPTANAPRGAGQAEVGWRLRAMRRIDHFLLLFAALLQLSRCSSDVPPAPTCEPSPASLQLASVAPAAGSEPVWMVDGNFGCWHEGGPTKTLWIVDRRYAGSLEVRGESVTGEAVVTFQREGKVMSPHLIVPNASQSSVIPGGASDSERARYSFHSSYLVYPHPGCWRLTSSLGGRPIEIVVEQARCDPSRGRDQMP